MPRIVPIVEGDGEESAFPVLLAKILKKLKRHDIHIATPKKAHGRSNLTKDGGLERFIQLAWKEPDCGAILLLLDADKDCPLQLATVLSKRIAAIGIKYPVFIVVARRMYEAWFLASIETLSGKPLGEREGLRAGLVPIADVEAKAGIKKWLDENLPPGRTYKETLDQEAMTRLLDIELARSRSRSFQRLCHAIEEAIAAIDNNLLVVTPTAEAAES